MFLDFFATPQIRGIYSLNFERLFLSHSSKHVERVNIKGYLPPQEPFYENINPKMCFSRKID